MNFLAFSDEFLKLSAVTREEAEGALKRLKTLEETKPTGGQIARGALAGAGAGTLATIANNLVSGRIVGGIRDVVKAAPGGRAAMAKQVGLSALGTLGGNIAGTTAFGAAMPILRGHLDRKAEIAKLKEYVGTQPAGSIPQALHHKLTKVVGV